MRFPPISITLPAWVESEVGPPEQRLCSPEEMMELAIRLAARNVAEATGGPFGAVVFRLDTGEVVAPGVNLVVGQSTSVAHAEIVALSLAQQQLGMFDLSVAPHVLASSAQPCIQCFGALWWSGISTLYFGASGADVESLTGFSEGPLPEDWCAKLALRTSLPKVEVFGGIKRREARAVLADYKARGGVIYNPGGKAR